MNSVMYLMAHTQVMCPLGRKLHRPGRSIVSPAARGN